MYNLLFDLDGTLVDTSLPIYKSIHAAEEKLGVKYDGDYSKFIGPPIFVGAEELLHLSKEDAKRFADAFADAYKVNLESGNKIYRGMVSTAKACKRKCRLFVCTYKKEEFAKTILTNLGLAKYFDGIYGKRLDGENKVEIVNKIKNDFSLDSSRMALIGDAVSDIVTAKRCGIKSVGVTYGFGDYTDIINAKPDFIAKSPIEIKEILEELCV